MSIRAHRLPLLSALVIAALAAFPAARADERIPKNFGRDRSVDLEHLALRLAVDIPSERAEGSAEYAFTALRDDTREIELDAVQLDIRRVTVGGAEVPFHHDGAILRITLATPLALGAKGTLRVEYAASRPRNGLYFVHAPGARRDLDQCWSQGETHENSSWFPVHDWPAERLTSETWITVAEPLTVVSNGPLLDVSPAGPGLRTFHHRLDFPHVPYLVSIAVGAWATTSETWRGKELTFHAPADRAADMARTYANTARILEYLSNEIGVEYPYPVYRQVAVTDFTYGGMENIAATTLTDQTLHDERAHSDWRSDSLVAHEAAHQWFGDYVTCRDWDDTWLNEGFATYYAALAMGDLHGPAQLAVELDGMRQGAISADAGAGRRPIVTNRWRNEGEMFDGHSYAKGGMVLHALRRELGDAEYRKSIAAWLARFAGQSAGTHDLIDVIEDVTGRDVSRFFDQWIFNGGQPDLKVKWRWDKGDCAITVVQSQASAEGDGAFDTWLDVQLAGDGWSIARPLRLSRREETFHVASEKRPEAVLVDPQGWLLRTLDLDREDREAAWVLRHATDVLPRLEAARELKNTAGLPGNIEAIVEVARGASEWMVRREACSALELAATEEGTRALLAAMTQDADSRVRSAAAAALGRHPGADVRAALERALTSDASYAVRAAAARALGQSKEPGAERVLEAATAQRSHREEVLGASLDAMAELRAPRLRAVAERLVAPTQPYVVRARAVAALGRVAKTSMEDADRTAIVKELVALLEDSHYRVRTAACDALVTAGDAAALGDLRRLAASHPHELTRRRASSAVRGLEAAVAKDTTVAELRRALEDERKKREELDERVRKLEARMPPEDTGSAP